VHPAHQRRGVALQMYQHVLDLMRARGVKHVTAETEGHSARDPLRRAYERAGFVGVPVVRYVADLGMPSRFRGGASAPSAAHSRPNPSFAS